MRDRGGIAKPFVGLCFLYEREHHRPVGLRRFALVGFLAACFLPALSAPISSSKDDPHFFAVWNKLGRLVIPKVDFQKEDVGDVVRFLTTESKRLDPDHKGFNFVLRYPTSAQAPEGGFHREVTIVLHDVPMNDVVEYITQQTNLSVRIEKNDVFLEQGVDY